MRTHIQGLALLLLLAVTIWGTAQLAGPALGDAFGDDGAVVAESAEDEVDLSLGIDDQPDEALTETEVGTTQWLLHLQGFLDSPDDIDGILGPGTRQAMQEAKGAYGFPQASDRTLLEHLEDITVVPFATPAGSEEEEE